MVARRFDGDEWKFTKAGNQFYKQLRRNFVVKVPVIIRGRRKDRSRYEIKGLLPIERAGITAPELPIDASTPTRNRKARELVEQQIPANGIIFEVSEETYIFDPDGAFYIFEETIATDPDSGQAEAHVNYRRMGCWVDLSSQLYRPQDLCEEAFEHRDDKLCCQRQIARVLGIELDAIIAMLDELDPLASAEGCTPNLILAFSKQFNYGCVCLHNNRPTITPPGEPILAFNILDNHCYMYNNQAVCKTVMKWGGGDRERLKRKFTKAKAWARPAAIGPELTAGNLWCLEEEVDGIMRKLLAQGVVPKIALRTESQIRSLSYGKTTVQVLPLYWQQIEQWMEKLGLSYSGQNLASAAFEVLCQLIHDQNSREQLTPKENHRTLEESDYRCVWY